MSRPHQDWEPVSWNKSGQRQKGVTKDQEINQALRRGDGVETEKKFLGGQNKATKGGLCTNARKVEEDTGDYHVERVSADFSRALQQARQAKKMTQAQLAQAINEKPSVVNDYESGRAIPNGAVVQKLNRALGVSLPKAKEKRKPVA
ncbi:putative multiprotein bridging factor type 1 family transcriptional co-activator [Besnoitia besnoiti]|uniref:Putative multiprotein bridging factor type 1 family transcriptional co-activator n=1 Tax=Besnoitia besnoiti TaxID=94643 RepID=A0A2A9LXZ4_BESBE|nr:putative multiprotein bridging factor type 1 family transcriptional co-activator [Besnoitia besnoiti]PFH31338.1 putative multiprotein bridging factor type 1 family transcriptional co-activator [Besnoitia besnoiti]